VRAIHRDHGIFLISTDIDDIGLEMRAWRLKQCVVVCDGAFVFLECGFEAWRWDCLGGDEVQWNPDQKFGVVEEGRAK